MNVDMPTNYRAGDAADANCFQPARSGLAVGAGFKPLARMPDLTNLAGQRQRDRQPEKRARHDTEKTVLDSAVDSSATRRDNPPDGAAAAHAPRIAAPASPVPGHETGDASRPTSGVSTAVSIGAHEPTDTYSPGLQAAPESAGARPWFHDVPAAAGTWKAQLFGRLAAAGRGYGQGNSNWQKTAITRVVGVAAMALVCIMIWRVMQPDELPNFGPVAHNAGELPQTTTAAEVTPAEGGQAAAQELPALADRRVIGEPTLADPRESPYRLAARDPAAADPQLPVDRPFADRLDSAAGPEQLQGPVLGSPTGRDTARQTLVPAAEQTKEEPAGKESAPPSPQHGRGTGPVENWAADTLRSDDGTQNRFEGSFGATSASREPVPATREAAWPTTYFGDQKATPQTELDPRDETPASPYQAADSSTPSQARHHSAPQYAATDPATFEYLGGNIQELRHKLLQQSEAIASRNVGDASDTADLRGSDPSRPSTANAPQGVVR